MINSKIFLCFLLALNFFDSAIANVHPKDSASLHYSRVYFEENFVETAVKYELQIFADRASMTEGKMVASKTFSLPAFTVQNLSWGKSYLWKINAYDLKKNLIKEGLPHYFSIIPLVKNNNIRDLKIAVNTNKTDKHLGGLIAIDYAKMFCDRSGNAIWVLPEVKGLHNTETQVRDLKLTKFNTITFLSNGLPLEIDYDGNLLWRLPHPFVYNNDTITFHHTFTRINDSYFVLGNKNVLRKVLEKGTQKAEVTQRDVKINDTLYRKIEVGILLEFDKNGKVLWFWDANDYIKDIDLNYKKVRAGMPNMQTHANGFNLSADLTKVYVSFRDLSRIVRIDKKTKKVEISYGEKYPSGDAQYGDGMFVQQHDPNPTERKTILLFNNNGARNKETSSIVEIKDKGTSNDSILVWKFALDFDTLSNGKSVSGGNVMELPNGNIFLASGYLHRIFEVTRNKEIVWDAFLYCKNISDTAWQKFPQYRARWISKMDDQRFIVQQKTRSTKSNFVTQTLTIYNVGDAVDSYLIEILNGDKTIRTQKTDKIKSQGSSQQFLNINYKDLDINMLKIRIRSVSNPNRWSVIDFN